MRHGVCLATLLTQTHAYSQEHLVLIGLSHGFFGVLITVKVPSQRKYIIKQRSLFQDYLLVKKEPKYVMFETSKASDLKNSSTHGKPDAWLLEVLYAHMHAKNLCKQRTVKNTMLQEDNSRKALDFFLSVSTPGWGPAWTSRERGGTPYRNCAKPDAKEPTTYTWILSRNMITYNEDPLAMRPEWVP